MFKYQVIEPSIHSNCWWVYILEDQEMTFSKKLLKRYIIRHHPLKRHYSSVSLMTISWHRKLRVKCINEARVIDFKSVDFTRDNLFKICKYTRAHYVVATVYPPSLKYDFMNPFASYKYQIERKWWTFVNQIKWASTHVSILFRSWEIHVTIIFFTHN